VIINPARTQVNLLSTQKRSLLGYWPLNEKSGSIAYDYSGNKLHGTLINSPLRTVMDNGIGVATDHASYQYVSIPASGTKTQITGPLTVGCRFLTSYTGHCGIISQWQNNANANEDQSFAIEMNSGAIQISLNALSGTDVGVTVPGTYNDGKPHTLYAVIAGTNVKVYIDFYLVRDYTGSDTFVAGSTGNIVFGAHAVAAGNFAMTGIINEVRIYTSSLTAAQIANIAVGFGGFWKPTAHCPLVFEAPWLTIAANTCPTSAPDLGLTTSALLTLANLSMAPITSTAELTTALQLLIEDIAAHPSLSTTTIQQAVALICVEILCASHTNNPAMSAPDDLTSLALSMRSQSALSLALDDPASLATSINRMVPNSPVTALAQALWLLIENIGMSPDMPASSIPSILSLALAQCTVTAVSDTVEMTRAVYLALEPITGRSYLNNIELGNALIGIGKLMNPNIKIATPPLSLHSATPSYTLRKI
jgi:hypothetical protein